MNRAFVIIVVHQLVFQGMFFAKNVSLRRRLRVPIRGRNPEASVSIAFFGLFIVASLVLAAIDTSVGTVCLVGKATAFAVATLLLLLNLSVGVASLLGLRDSWRVGIPEGQKTELIEGGIYRFTRNPYFVSYLVMFAAYTLLLQNVILLGLSIVGFVLIHAMVLKEERHLSARHGDSYRQYQARVPRYVIM